MPAAIGLAIGSFLFAAGAPLAIVNFFAIGIGGSLVFGAGLLLASNLLRPGGAGQQSVKPSDGQQSLRQSVPARWKSYGRVRLAGVVFWFEAELATGVLHYGLALNHGRIYRVVERFIDDNAVDVDENNDITTAPYSTLTTAQWITHLGLPAETAYAEIESAFATEEVRGDGVASELILLDNFTNADDQFVNFPNGLPKIKTTIDASVVWDPRDPGIVTPATPTTLYTNPLGSGNRTTTVTITGSAAFPDPSTNGARNNLVDGAFAANGTDSCNYLSATVDGDYLQFDFGVPKYIDEVKIYADRAIANGSWKWQVSSDGSTFADLNTFTWNTQTQSQAVTGMSVYGFRYLRMTKVGATTITNAFYEEFEFKLAAGAEVPAAHQQREDETTWGWSENPVVCLLNYMLDPDGYAIPWERIEPNIAEWKAAADICDEQVLSLAAGGYESRYRLAMTFLLTDRPTDVVARILASCDGKCWQKRDGSIGIVVGRFVRPTVTVGDSHIISYELTRGQDRLSAVAGIRAQYMSPDHDYLEQDAEPWPDGETVTELGEDRVGSLDLTMVPSHSQARRLMKRAAVRAAAGWKGTIRTTLAGLRVIDERFVNLAISELGVAETFEVGKFTLDLGNMQCQMEVSAVGAEIDDWDPVSEEGTAPTIVSGLVFVEKDTGTLTSNFDDTIYEARLIDGSRVESADTAAKRTGSTAYAVFAFDSPKAFGKAILTSPFNTGFVHAAGFAQVAANVTVTVRGKNATIPSDGDDGTLLATYGPFAHVPSATELATLLSTDTATAYDFWVYKIAQDNSAAYRLAVAEIDHWEYV